MVEGLGDAATLLLPATRQDMAGALERLKISRLLDGYRGSPALDIDAVAKLIAGLGRVLAGTPSIREIDLNPVVVYPKGEGPNTLGVVAIDALILAE